MGSRGVTCDAVSLPWRKFIWSCCTQRMPEIFIDIVQGLHELVSHWIGRIYSFLLALLDMKPPSLVLGTFVRLPGMTDPKHEGATSDEKKRGRHVGHTDHTLARKRRQAIFAITAVLEQASLFSSKATTSVEFKCTRCPFLSICILKSSGAARTDWALSLSSLLLISSLSRQDWIA